MRWFTIRIRRISISGDTAYVWSDWAGWGPGTYLSWTSALRAALRGHP
jgi:hypothetical protein